MASGALGAHIGHNFADPALLRRALTHRSHGAHHYERLEFLGDSVLNCVIASELYRRFPDSGEGELTLLRASIVNQQSLVAVAQGIELGDHLLLGDGELKSGGAQRPSILADALEAVLGAVFVDGGFEAARGVALHLFAAALDRADPRAAGKDPKTLLQELLQARRIPLPKYAVIATAGDAHERTFRVECVIPELNIRTQGEGASRRSAEQAAAHRAYELGIRT